ncbi:MAG: phosphoribosyl-AMP cyclohydrolase, partial [Thermoproteota archaeon]
SVEKTRKIISQLNFEKGLIPVVARNVDGEVLMVAFMNKYAFLKTLSTGFMHYYSRRRRRAWMKGEKSGFRQRVLEVRVNCENDSLLFTVRQEGPGACHMGYKTCFYRKILRSGSLKKVGGRVFNPRRVYGNRRRG